MKIQRYRVFFGGSGEFYFDKYSEFLIWNRNQKGSFSFMEKYDTIKKFVNIEEEMRSVSFDSEKKFRKKKETGLLTYILDDIKLI